ncbi:DUF1499 domain-containing protein [Parvularcula sp. LCG005]|uniref:DUF1499 domain-containing protein n=1 Tax=Parvularcula sp. LCG005 TaxID=3078805 RepID=UPI002943EE2F|nr:DUF1499 domain-containing protein [Parvularcula sp. LCG005]WOI52554.1 DUF1499 domain-containing protein [Parvularcula sp. LCG005]
MTDFIDFASLERPKAPNHYLVAPEGLCQSTTPDEDAPEFRDDPDAMFMNIVQMVRSKDNVQDIEVDESARRLSFVSVTSFFKFKDDVDIAVLPGAAGSTVAIYSRSRVGKGDFGKNKKRVHGLIADLRKTRVLAEGEGGVTAKDPGIGAGKA